MLLNYEKDLQNYIFTSEDKVGSKKKIDKGKIKRKKRNGAKLPVGAFKLTKEPKLISSMWSTVSLSF